MRFSVLKIVVINTVENKIKEMAIIVCFHFKIVSPFLSDTCIMVHLVDLYDITLHHLIRVYPICKNMFEECMFAYTINTTRQQSEGLPYPRPQTLHYFKCDLDFGFA